MEDENPHKMIWLEEASKHIGKAEVPGKKSNPWIVSLWMNMKGSAVFKWLGSDDSAAPWCGTFVAHCVAKAGYAPPKHFYRAKAWLEWGRRRKYPTEGCVVVFDRKGGGHVGFVVGEDRTGNLLVLGGNQGDAVSVRPFDRSRVLGYRWPFFVYGIKTSMPVLASDGKPSVNEA